MNKKVSLIFIGLILSIPLLQAQNDVGIYAKSIKAKILKKHVYILASDSCEGRNIGTEGNLIARNYIMHQWEKGSMLKPYFQETWLQSFPLVVSSRGKPQLRIDNIELADFKDYMYTGLYDGFNAELPIVFVGYGNDQNLKNLDIKGKAVFALNDNLRAAMKNAQTCSKYGAALTIVANPENVNQFESLSRQFENFSKFKSYHSPDDSVFPGLLEKLANLRYVTVSNNMVKKLTSHNIGYWKRANVQGNDSIGAIEINIPKYQLDTIITNNIVAFLPGTEGHESIIVGAHYDHIGVINDKVNYGADDNASGTAALLELSKTFANAYADGYRPAKNIIFIAFSAEEGGLYGSKYFAEHLAEHNSVKLMINIDMIGRADILHDDNPEYFYFIAENLSDSLYAQNTILCKKYHLTPDYSSHIDASDQKSFTKIGIPTIFYFDGINRDLHKPTDTPNKIDYNRMEKITRMIFETVWINAGVEKDMVN